VSTSTTILDDIGNTPLLKLNHVTDSLDADILVKCEFMNPGGSIKDPMALCMIDGAERRGDLQPGGTILDQSTGNTGPALAFVGAVKGYDVRLFLPAQLSSSYNPADRIRIALQYGCDVTPIDLDDHMEGAGHLNGVEQDAAFVAIRMEHCHGLQLGDPSVRTVAQVLRKTQRGGSGSPAHTRWRKYWRNGPTARAKTNVPTP
jgi:cysteine synthase